MDKKVYLESTVISYLAARPSRDLLVLAKQHLTAIWWNNVFPRVQVYVSSFVMEEIQQGDLTAVAERMKFCKDIPLLNTTEEIESLANAYISMIMIPDRAKLDFYHIACATIYKMDFLLTWNCAHIANAFIRRKIETINAEHGFQTPVICTPDELLEV
ncbi:MAG: type II toxin-antitoxin system VapC family toxin [Deltaproteobacteria bacterium]|nr:type II toxin-antitoxin system VapC family toxin [Deltaproteobacteria bacterium]